MPWWWHRNGKTPWWWLRRDDPGSNWNLYEVLVVEWSIGRKKSAKGNFSGKPPNYLGPIVLAQDAIDIDFRYQVPWCFMVFEDTARWLIWRKKVPRCSKHFTRKHPFCTSSAISFFAQQLFMPVVKCGNGAWPLMRESTCRRGFANSFSRTKLKVNLNMTKESFILYHNDIYHIKVYYIIISWTIEDGFNVKNYKSQLIGGFQL